MMSYRLRAKRNSINQSGKKRLKKKAKVEQVILE